MEIYIDIMSNLTRKSLIVYAICIQFELSEVIDNISILFSVDKSYSKAFTVEMSKQCL